METETTNLLQIIIAWIIIVLAIGFTIRGIWKTFTKKKDCSSCTNCPLSEGCIKPEKEKEKVIK